MIKEDFVREFGNTITKWVKKHQEEILDFKSYRWKDRTYEESVKRRNELEQKIKDSRRENNGGIDLTTVDEIYDWGFSRSFPLRNEQEVIKATKDAFKFLDSGDYYQAARRLLLIKGVGPAGATKVLGLSDHENLCIYDSRVGNALKDLKKDNVKLILCPPDRSYKRDFDQTTSRGWAKNYERLIWAIEIMQEYFRTKRYSLRAADIEMALFVIGQ